MNYNGIKRNRVLQKINSDIGKKYGNLTIKSYRGKINGKHSVNVLCECGNSSYKTYYYVITGHTKSCGCMWKVAISNANATRNHASKEPLWSVYRGMIDRCYNPNNPAYHRYGGRGIRVCDRWQKDFYKFKQDVGERESSQHTLDRIDNDGDYESRNVRWATRKEQTHNSTVIKKYPYKGEMKRIVDIAEDMGLTVAAIYWRINKWGYEEAISRKRRIQK